MAFLTADSSSVADVKDISRLSWVMVLRVTIISALLGATIMMNRDFGEMIGASTRFLLALIVCTYLLTIGFAVWYRLGKRLMLLGYVQFVSDALLFSALSYATGGATSGFTFLFHLWVIVAVVSMGKRAGFIQATVSSVLILIVTGLMELHLLDPLSDVSAPSNNLSTTLYALSVNIVSLYIVAFLVNILAARLEFAGEGLQKERAQNEELARELEHAKRLAALGELAATLAHEIRNPLSAVSGSFQMLKSSLHPNDDEQMLAAIIERELDRMGRLVGDILEYARPRKTELHLVDLSKMCKETLHSFQVGIGQRDITVESTVQDGVSCNGDANQLRQVLWNLLVNAAQVVSDDTGVIHLAVEKMGSDVWVTVSDNGPGVPPELRTKVFDAFFSTRERGMGLGLALCQRIVTGHGGSVEIDDSPLGGARFRLTFPGQTGESGDGKCGSKYSK